MSFSNFPPPCAGESQPTMSKELLIKGGHVVTVDPHLGDLPAGDVLVADGVITAVGKDLKPATAEAEVIDAAGRLVVPGMVDTHRHVWQGAIGSYSPQITGAGYGPAVLTGIALKHTPEDVYAGTLWGALQALDAGITTIADWAHNNQSPAHADADLRGLRDSGIRGYFLYGGPGPATSDPNPPPTRQMPAACAMSISAPAVTADSVWAWRFVGRRSLAPSATPATSRSPATWGCRSPSTPAWPAPARR